MSDRWSELATKLTEVVKLIELLQQPVTPEGGIEPSAVHYPGGGTPPPPPPPPPPGPAPTPPGGGGIYCKACGTYNVF
ncbi:cytokinesis protein [Dyella sp. 333MFSha]|nr:cytokinesis protein [Dyella sp. 333MFSha]